MGAAHGKKKSYNIDHESQPPPKQQCLKNGKHSNSRACANLQQLCPDDTTPPPEHPQQHEDENLIKPKKLVNPVKASKSHQELHRELMSSCKRGGQSMQMKPELHRVLESRKRDQLIRQRKQEEEAHRKISPLEEELLRRHRKLEELEQQQQRLQEERLRAPEFVRVKENLRRTSCHSQDEKMV